jgi:beta-glucosidase
LTFNYTPQTSGNCFLSVLKARTATLYIHGKEAFHRPQEQHLQREAFYFCRSKSKAASALRWKVAKTYSIRLESWAAEPNARTIGGAVIQGSAVCFFESVHIPTQINRAWRASGGLYNAMVRFSAIEIVGSAKIEVREEFCWGVCRFET